MGHLDACLTVPPRSDGVSIAPFGNGGVAFDAVSETAHVLGPVEYAILASAADGSVCWPASADHEPGHGLSTEAITERLAAGVEALAERHLIGRSGVPIEMLQWPGSDRLPDARDRIGSTHEVIDRRVAFRGPNQDLIAELDHLYGGGTDARPDTFIDVLDQPGSDEVEVLAAQTWRFPDGRAATAQIVDIVNEYAARSDSVAVLHAGLVRRPDGTTMMLPGHADAGKSTLVGALVLAGCDYLGDESCGLSESLDVVPYPKPLSLSTASRAALGLPDTPAPHIPISELTDVVPTPDPSPRRLDRLIFPEFSPGGNGELEPIESAETLQRLMTNTLNLARSGDDGLTTLAKAAESVPAWKVVHSDARELAEKLLYL